MTTSTVPPLSTDILKQISSINLAELKAALDDLTKAHPDVKKVLLISPVVEDYNFIKQHFPQFDLYITQIHDWDLNKPCSLPLGQFDLAIASNVMMYAQSPQAWIDNVLTVSRYFAVQDLIYRKRGATSPYLGTGGDVMRFCHSGRSITSPFPQAFDLQTLRQKTTYFSSYQGGPNEFHAPADKPVHFVTIIESHKLDAINSKTTPALAKFKFKVRNLFFINAAINAIYRRASRLFQLITFAKK